MGRFPSDPAATLLMGDRRDYCYDPWQRMSTQAIAANGRRPRVPSLTGWGRYPSVPGSADVSEHLYQVFLPQGSSTPVSPGIRCVTFGGMVAADVHGKNHHVAGTVGRHVESLEVRVADRSVVTCSRAVHPDLCRRKLPRAVVRRLTF